MRQTLSIVLSLVLIVGISITGLAQQPTEIAFLHDWGGSTGIWMQDIVDRFNEQNPDIHVDIEIVAGGLGDRLLVSIMGNVAPEVVLLDRWTVSNFAAQGGLLPLTDLIARDGIDPADFFPPTWDEATFRGVSYGLPFNTDTRALVYHQGIFDESGLDANNPPSTWSELQENAMAVTRRDGSGNLTQVGYVPHWGQPNFVHYLWQNAGSVFDEDQREVTFHGEEGIEALEWMVEFVDWYGGMEVLDAFSASMQSSGPLPTLIGKYQAIHYDGNWTLGSLRREFPDFYDQYLRVALPPGNKVRGTMSGGHALVMPIGADEAKKEAAWRFIKYLTSFEVQLEMGLETGNIPPLIEAATDYRYLDDEIRAVFVQSIEYARFRPNHPSYPRIDEILRGDVQHTALHKELAPVAALEEAARVAQAMLDEVNYLIDMDF